MYSIERNIHEGILIVRLVNLNTNESVSVLPEQGARIYQLVLLSHSSLRTIIPTSPDSVDGAIMFPFPDQVRNNRYYHEMEHIIPENATQHGLLIGKKFSIEKELASADRAQLQVKYESTGEPGYPFPFNLIVDFELSENGFSCKTSIHNRGWMTIPAAAGWNTCIELGAHPEEWSMAFNPKSELILDQKLVLTGAKVPSPALEEFQPVKSFPTSSCFSLASNEQHDIRIYNAIQKIGIHLWMQGGTRGMNYLKIIVPENPTQLKLVPMTAAPDAFNNALGLYLMETCDQYDFSWGVKIQS